MKRSFSFVSLGILDYAGRVLLTLFATVLFLVALALVMHAGNLLKDTQKGLKNMPGIFINQPVATHLGDPTIHPPWPEFPHNGDSACQSAVINGVQVVTEEWQCNASADEVISYYRDQMTARGWLDTTETTYTRNSELNDLGGMENVSEGQQLLKKYQDTLDTKLMLKSGKWSLHISAEPASSTGLITVKFYAAATSSIEDFTKLMASTFLNPKDASSRPVDVLQDSGSEHYHTTMSIKDQPPAEAVQAELEKLSAQGWKPVMELPKEKTPNGFFVWLTKGKEYASLQVNYMAETHNSSVTLIEVTPK